MVKYILLLSLPFLYLACQHTTAQTEYPSNQDIDQSYTYWHDGTAEINSYELAQERYGEFRKGSAILIFVSEDLSDRNQVKVDDWQKYHGKKINVLKLNQLRKFNTGIYDYSIMQSVFTPFDRVQYPHTIKVTTSAQDWCGHSFYQLNLEENKFRASMRSYFGEEGDKDWNISTAFLEDEIFNRIRMGPESLPIGKQEIILGALHSRFTHTPIKAYNAHLSLTKESADIFQYSLDFPALERKLSIRFSSSFPYQIESWTDSYPTGFDGSGPIMSSTARRIKTLKEKYWSRHSEADSTLRTALGI